MKKLSSLCLILSIILILNIQYVKAETNNLEQMSSQDRVDTIQTLIYGIVKNDVSQLNKVKLSVKTDIYQELIKYASEDNFYGGDIIECKVETTFPDKSSTGDTVIMANTKINYTNYTLLYLFEFHVDINGEIYGYNIWVY